MKAFKSGQVDQYEIPDAITTYVDDKIKVLQFDRDGHCKDTGLTLKDIENNPDYTDAIIEAELFTRAENAKLYATDSANDESKIVSDINTTYDEIQKTIEQ